jgi:uncharacterized membrane protein YbhN (UPF0104 family)
LFERPVTIHLGGLAGAALGVLAVAVALTALIYLREDAVSRIVCKVFSPFSDRAAEHATHLVASFASGLHVVRHGKRLASVSLLSLLVWLPAGLAIYPVLHAFPTEVQWPWYTSLVVLAVVCVGIMVPAAPGYVGTFHAACVAGLLLCAPVDFDTALAFSVVYHGANVVVLVIAGLICLAVENVSFLEVVRRAESGSAEDAPAS